MEWTDLAEHINLTTVDFSLSTRLWNDFHFDEINLQTVSWNKTKFLHDNGLELSPGMRKLPNKKGGLYLFIIDSNIIPGHTKYLAYIGKAWFTPSENLRKRCSRYFNEYIRNDERPKITKMIKYWGRYLYLMYIELENNDLIDELEKRLINTIIPPFNDEIFDKKIREAKKAW
jgi:hypothetical protein